MSTNSGKFKDILANFNTGDILLFHGSNYLFSYIIEWATWSEYSHVGIVLKDPTYIDPALTGYFLLESGTENFPDAVYHKINLGVQIVNLEAVLDQYQGRIYHRPLSVSDDIKPKIPVTLCDTWQKIKELPYDYSPWDLFRAKFGVNYGNTRRTDSFFCSALSTFIYEQCQLLNQSLDWDLVEPKDWDQKGKIDTCLSSEVILGPRSRIK